jgi:hypothetical protein
VKADPYHDGAASGATKTTTFSKHMIATMIVTLSWIRYNGLSTEVAIDRNTGVTIQVVVAVRINYALFSNFVDVDKVVCISIRIAIRQILGAHCLHCPFLNKQHDAYPASSIDHLYLRIACATNLGGRKIHIYFTGAYYEMGYFYIVDTAVYEVIAQTSSWVTSEVIKQQPSHFNCASVCFATRPFPSLLPCPTKVN